MGLTEARLVQTVSGRTRQAAPSGLAGRGSGGRHAPPSPFAAPQAEGDTNSLAALLSGNLSDNTKRTYSSAWRHFLSWAAADGTCPDLPLSVDTVLAYIEFCATEGRVVVRDGITVRVPLSVATVHSYVTAIRMAHRLVDVPFPDHADPRRDRIRLKLSQKRREQGSAPRKARAISEPMLVQMVTSRPDTTAGLRDRVVLLVGFAGAFRRSELAAIDIEHIEFRDDEGMVIYVPRSKTDQPGEGATIYIGMGRHVVTCPVRQTQRWINRSCRQSGPLLVGMRRGDHPGTSRITGTTIDAVVKACAADVGASAAEYSAHSLRSGLATSAAGAGARNDVIMRQTRHASFQSLLGYIQAGTGFKDNVMHYLSLL